MTGRAYRPIVKKRKENCQKTSSCLLKRKTAVRNMQLTKTHDRFCFSSFETPFFSSHFNFWDLPEPFLCNSGLETAAIADRYEHFIFLPSPVGVRVRFAFQKPSLCLTSNVSRVLCQWRVPRLPLPLAQVGDPKDVRDFDEGRVHRDPALTAAFKHFWVIKRTWGLRGAGCFRQISHLWIRSFLTTILKRRCEGHTGISKVWLESLCVIRNIFLCSNLRIVSDCCEFLRLHSPNSLWLV